MALRTASLILVASATCLKEILWDSLFAFKYFPGDSIVSGGCVSPSDFIYNPLKRFSKIIINGFYPFVNPVRNSSGALNPAGIILKSNVAAEQRGIISNGVNRAYPLLADVSNNIPMEEDRFSKIEDGHIISRCNYRKICRK